MTKNEIGEFTIINNTLKAIIIIFTLFFLIVPVHSDDGIGCPQHRKKMRHHRPSMFHNPEFLREKLGMSGAQIADLKKINKAHREKMENLRDQIEPHRTALRKYLIQEKVDLKKVRIFLEKISQIEVEIRLSIIKHQMDVENILTPEMRKTLKKERRGLMQRMK